MNKIKINQAREMQSNKKRIDGIAKLESRLPYHGYRQLKKKIIEDLSRLLRQSDESIMIPLPYMADLILLKYIKSILHEEKVNMLEKCDYDREHIDKKLCMPNENKDSGHVIREYKASIIETSTGYIVEEVY